MCVCAKSSFFLVKVNENVTGCFGQQVSVVLPCDSHNLRNPRVGTVEGTFGNPERRGLVAMVTHGDQRCR